MKNRVIIIILLLLINCAGKEKLPKYVGFTDQQLYKKATDYLNKKKWEEAREVLRYLLENFTDSQLIMPAKLSLADSYYYQGGSENYAVAVSEYEDFIKLYPSSPKADYAQFQIGMSYFKQMQKPGRDQQNSIKAIEAFKKLIETYPRSSYSQEGYKNMILAYKNIIEHEFSIAKFYIKMKKYKPAMYRLKEIFKNYPEEAISEKVYYYYAESLKRLGLREESKKYYNLLVEKFPHGEFRMQALEALQSMGESSQSIHRR